MMRALDKEDDSIQNPDEASTTRWQTIREKLGTDAPQMEENNLQSNITYQ